MSSHNLLPFLHSFLTSWASWESFYIETILRRNVALLLSRSLCRYFGILNDWKGKLGESKLLTSQIFFFCSIFLSSSEIFLEKHNDAMLSEFFSLFPDLTSSDVSINSPLSPILCPFPSPPKPRIRRKNFLLHVCDKITTNSYSVKSENMISQGKHEIHFYHLVMS